MLDKNRGRATCPCHPLRLGVLGVVPIIFMLILASCGGSKPPTATTGRSPTPAVTGGQPTPTPAAVTNPSPGPTAPGVARCGVGSLAIARTTGDAAMGGLRVDTFRMTNTGRSPCSLYGYVGMQMLDSSRNPMATNVVRNGGSVAAVNPGPSLVLLQPGKSASFFAGWRAWEDGGTTCPAASMLQITPPDEYDHLTLPVTWGLAPCLNGEIDVTAVQPSNVGT